MKKTASLITNLLVAILNSYALVNIYINGLGGNMTGTKTMMFRFFTIDSNILLVIASIVTVICILKQNMPEWCVIFKFASVHAVTVTLLVACCFLSLSYGFMPMIKGNNFFLHLFCPLIALLSFIFLEKEKRLKGIFWALVPSIIYGIIYYILVVEKEIWPDFYGFNRGGKWYIAVIAMTVFETVLALAIRKIYNSKGVKND